VYLTLDTISPPKVVTQLPKPNKDLSLTYINRAHPLLKGEAKRKSVEAKEKLSTID
jgi:hypothetical protein